MHFTQMPIIALSGGSTGRKGWRCVPKNSTSKTQLSTWALKPRPHSVASRCLKSTVSEMTYTVSSGTLNSTIPYHASRARPRPRVLPCQCISCKDTIYIPHVKQTIMIQLQKLTIYLSITVFKNAPIKTTLTIILNGNSVITWNHWQRRFVVYCVGNNSVQPDTL